MLKEIEMVCEIYYDDGGRPEEDYVREEPFCYTCADGQRVLIGAAGQPDLHGSYAGRPMCTTNCPDCNPSPEQIACREAALVASGKNNFDDDPAF